MGKELLLAKLTPKAQSLDPKVDGTPGERISWEDIDRAMAGLHGGPLEVIRAKYLDDPKSVHGIVAAVTLRVQEKGWMDHSKYRKGLWYGVSKAVTYDFLDERMCPKCNGTGIRIDQRACKSCDASGKRKRGDEELLEIAGISQDELDSVKSKYKILLEIISGWETIGLGHIGKKLGN